MMLRFNEVSLKSFVSNTTQIGTISLNLVSLSSMCIFATAYKYLVKIIQKQIVNNCFFSEQI